jgi:hypothetical protein
MGEIVKFSQVEEKILTIRNQSVLLDSDVAGLYGVETMRVNEAVKNNPEKFPEGYILELTKDEKKRLSKFSITLLQINNNENHDKEGIIKTV